MIDNPAKQVNHPQLTTSHFILLLCVQFACIPLIALGEYAILVVILITPIALFLFFNRIEYSIIILPLFIFIPFEIPEALGLQFSELGVFLLLVSFLGYLLIANPLEMHFSFPALKAIALIIFAGLLSMINAKYYISSIKFIFKHIEAYILVLFIVVNFLKTKRDLKHALFAISLGGLIAALFGIMRFFQGTEVRVFGLHGAAYGGFIGIAVLCTLAYIIYGPNKINKIYFYSILPILVFALLLSQTRAWIIGTFLGVGYLVVSIKQPAKRVKLLFVLAVFVGAFFIVASSNLMNSAANVEFATQKAFKLGVSATDAADRGKMLSTLIRVFIWWHGFNIYLNYPIFGFGWGNLRFRNMLTGELGSPNEQVAGSVDNHLLSSWFETGILGLIGWLWLIAILYRHAKFIHRSAESADWYFISRALCASLLMFAFGSVFWVLNTSHETVVMLPYLFGLLFVASRLLKNIKDSHNVSEA